MEEIEKNYFQSIEDFILLVGTSVAFIAFILWCCFPIEPKDSLGGSEHLSTQVIYIQKKYLSMLYVNEDHCRQVNDPNPLIFNNQCCSNNVKKFRRTLIFMYLSFQTADAVYDAKYKQLTTSPGCRKPGLQELMQYDINT